MRQVTLSAEAKRCAAAMDLVVRPRGIAGVRNHRHVAAIAAALQLTRHLGQRHINRAAGRPEKSEKERGERGVRKSSERRGQYDR